MEDERDWVKDRYVKSDVILERICQVVNDWDEEFFQPEEWQIAQMIHKTIREDEKEHTHWTSLPPWKREEE